MAHTNYNNVSNKTKPNVTNVAPAAQPEPATAAPVPEPEAPSAATIGTVFDCKKLNVRTNPNVNAQVLFTINKGTEVKIDLEESTAEWYKVLVNHQEGFCMKKYITLPQ